MRCLVLMALGLVACEPSSATDKERGRREMREMLARNAEQGERRRVAREANRELIARFEGQVQPGVGCEVCPDLCEDVDLRQVPVVEFHRMYREAALAHGYSKDRKKGQIAWLELLRLACIARDGGAVMREAWLALVDGDQDPAVRYAAAVHAVQHDLALEAGLRVLGELAAGTSKFAELAEIRIDEYKTEVVPTL